MVDPLRRVVVRRPDELFGSADPTVWHYRSRPDLAVARIEHDALVGLLRESGAEVVEHDAATTRSADAVYVHDPCIVTDAGAVLLRMGKELRGDEPESIGATLEALGIPIFARLDGTARAEGGDLVWVDQNTLAVGVGFRTNREGQRQLEDVLRPLGVSVIAIEIPVPDDCDICLHLMSFLSLVDHNLAVVDPLWLPGRAREFLERRGFRLIEVAANEVTTMAANVVAVAPRDCIMLEGNPVTERRLVAAGCRVRTFPGREISLNCEGGPTCLTRPIHRVPG